MHTYTHVLHTCGQMFTYARSRTDTCVVWSVRVCLHFYTHSLLRASSFSLLSLSLCLSFSLVPLLPVQDTKRTMPRIARQCREKRLRDTCPTQSRVRNQPPMHGLGSGLVRLPNAYRMSPAIAGYDHAGFSFSFILAASNSFFLKRKKGKDRRFVQRCNRLTFLRLHFPGLLGGLRSPDV